MVKKKRNIRANAGSPIPQKDLSLREKRVGKLREQGATVKEAITQAGKETEDILSQRQILAAEETKEEEKEETKEETKNILEPSLEKIGTTAPFIEEKERGIDKGITEIATDFLFKDITEGVIDPETGEPIEVRSNVVPFSLAGGTGAAAALPKIFKTASKVFRTISKSKRILSIGLGTGIGFGQFKRQQRAKIKGIYDESLSTLNDLQSNAKSGLYRGNELAAIAQWDQMVNQMRKQTQAMKNLTDTFLEEFLSAGGADYAEMVHFFDERLKDEEEIFIINLRAGSAKELESEEENVGTA